MNTILNSQSRFFLTGESKSIAFRVRALDKINAMLDKYYDEIIKALKNDLGKSEEESYLTEIALLKEEIRYYKKHIHSFAKPKLVSTPINIMPARSYLYTEPKGVVLIISPWNYPIFLTISPLIVAIASGNCVILKPSEISKASESIIEKMISETFDKDYIAVVKGDYKVSEQLLKLPFNHIFFTGSSNVGKIVMKTASENLTPVTLELGGKSPTIVDSNVDIDLAAKNIVWGKLINAGQTCIAPDYIFVHTSVKEKLISKMIEYIESFYSNNVFKNNEYPKIINRQHFDRLLKLIDEKKVQYGGRYDERTLIIEPTIMDNSTQNDLVMKEEIFGPLFPVMSYDSINEVINYINSNPKPLSLYLFSNDKGFIDKIISSTSSGGISVNDTLIHLINNNLPFGGIGASGMGAYHGRRGFIEFSHEKPVVKKLTIFNIPLKYPPFKGKLKWFKLFMR